MKRILTIFLIALIVITCLISVSYGFVVWNALGRTYDDIDEIPHIKVGILLATSPITPGGAHNYYFENRIKSAEKLYKAGKIDYIIASGGDYTQTQKNGCDEPLSIRDSLIARGIPEDIIILDYEGTRTLNSMAKAKEIYGLDSVILISQKYHNERAIYLADKSSIHAIGYNAEPSPIRRNRIKNTLRELFARPKMFLDFLISPKTLSHKLPGNYEEIKETLSNYLNATFSNELSKKEFIYTEFDTVNRLYAPIFFRYREPINGYKVEGAFYLGSNNSADYQNEDCRNVMAQLFFTSDSITFNIFQASFRPYSDSIPKTVKIFDCVELEYKVPHLRDSSKISLDSLSDLPFFFLDIDFDGNKELLLECPDTGQKSISTYDAYKIPELTNIDPFENYHYNFNYLDEWTEFDYNNKVVISSLWGGYDGSEKWYFKYQDDKLIPFKKEEYTEWFDKLKETTLLNE